MSKNFKFSLALGFQTLALIAIIIYKMSISLGGTEVFLRIEPYDPRDPFRGDYITFRYSDLSTISLYYIRGDADGLKKGQEVYVTLEKQDRFWLPINVTKAKPDTDELIIKGIIDETSRSLDTINLKYGIEEYFIPEGTGQNIFFDDKETVAKVAIDENGNAVLKEIYLDGKLWP